MMHTQTILFVGRDQDTALTFKENLSILNKKYEIITASEYMEAVIYLKNVKADLMVLSLGSGDNRGNKFLSDLYKEGIWLPTIVLSHEKINENSKEFKDFGIVESYSKPYLAEKIAVNIDDILKGRQKKDIIKNFGLPAIMQLIEIEKRSGILTIEIGKENGRIFFRDGKLMDLTVGNLSTGDALRECMNSLYEDREISIEYINHNRGKKINMSLMQMVMEASRINDERTYSQENGETKVVQPETELEQIAPLADLLKSMREVEHYVIASQEGDVLEFSTGETDESVVNSSLYLWVIGEKMKELLETGDPLDMIYYRNHKKRLIRKHRNYIIIMDLAEITKFSVFKQKLNELFEKLALD